MICPNCGGANLTKVAKGSKGRFSSKTHFYCRSCNNHSKKAYDKDTGKLVTV